MNPQNGYNGNQRMVHAMQQAQAALAASSMPSSAGTATLMPWLVLWLT
jgi:hypothetical protein